MSYTDHEIRGVGGWLAFFVIVIGVLSPLRLAIGLYFHLYGQDARMALVYGTTWVPLQIGEWATAATCIAGCLYIAWRLLNVETWRSVRITIAGLWLLGIGAPLIEIILVGLTGRLSIELAARTLGAEVAQPILVNAIWTAYFLRSRRVANTYARYEGNENAAQVFT